MKKIDNFTLHELTGIVAGYGEPAFRAGQLFSWLYKVGVSSYDEMTNISKPFKEMLSKDFEFTKVEEVLRTPSADGSVKFLFELDDGEKIESVLLKDGDRVSGCISTQVGCRMGCKFCATAGAVGFKRNLTVSEILRQIFHLRNVADELYQERLGNLVFMGMGEPLDNIINLKAALELILDDEALGFSHRKVTVSTCGIIEGIQELFKMKQPVNLAVSLNASTQDIRRAIMPISNKYPLDMLIKTLQELELDKRKRITLEYVLLDRVNDSMKDAQNLLKISRSVNAKINLIVYNSSPYSDFRSSRPENVMKFQDYLVKNKVSAFIRKRLGSDISGACGQLAAGYSGQK